MKTDKPDDSYWNRADEIIHLANSQSKKTPHGEVSSSLLYATARFNAFIISSSSNSVEDLKRDKSAAIEYFTTQYKNMLTENIDENIKNFSNNDS